MSPQRLRAGVITGVVSFALAFVVTAHASGEGDLEVGLFTESVSVSVSGSLNLGGPFAPGASVWAHPAGSAAAAPAVVTNSGNTEFNRIYVSYAGPQGAEAECDGGDGFWQAVTSSSPGEDQFRMRVWVSTSTSTAFTAFNNGSAVVPPGGVTGNVLSATILAGDTSQFMVNINVPNPPVVGGQGCYINLVLTAAAEAE